LDINSDIDNFQTVDKGGDKDNNKDDFEEKNVEVADNELGGTIIPLANLTHEIIETHDVFSPLSMYCSNLCTRSNTILKNIFLSFFSLALVMVLGGCSTHPPRTTGTLGLQDHRRVVIVGENINPHIAAYYQNKYEALVWFTPYQGKFVKNASNFLQNGLGSSVALKSLIKELQSINYTVGKWEIILPGIAENYFLAALKKMDDHALSKARGVVVLIDSTKNKDLDEQLLRVTDGNFFVINEFRKSKEKEN
jgi:hypothetical protein